MEKKLPQIKIREWNEKPRTKLRFIKIGDIFCYQFSEEMFVFGQILGKVNVGHVIQFFDFFQASPTITVEELSRAQFIGKPIIIDSYTLFDRSPVWSWQIIGHQVDFDPSPFKDLAFKWGDPNGLHFGKVWLDGRREPKIFSREEVEELDWEACVGSIVYNRILEEELASRGNKGV